MLHTLYQPNEISFKSLLEKDDYSKTYIKNNLWKYHYVFTKLLYLTRITKDSNRFAKVNMETLDNILGNSKIKGKMKRFSTQIVEDFVKWKIVIKRFDLTTDDNGIYKTIYLKFFDEVINMGWVKYEDPENTITTKLTAKMNKTNKQPLTGVYLTIQKYLPSITIDAVAALNYAYTAYTTQQPLRCKKKGHKLIQNRFVDAAIYSHWITVINEIQAGNYNLVVDHLKTGRVFTCISNMPKQLRSFLRINNKKLVEIDIANSQPLLFCIYLLKHYGSTNLPDDVKEYITLCETGKFYDTIKELVVTENQFVNDDTFKSEFFGKIFFSTETINYKWRSRFDNRFSNVSAAISSAKVNNYKELSITLSNLESEIIIKNVTAKLYRSGINTFTTIHDSILCTPDVVDECYNIILDEFKAYGINPTLKVNEL